MSQKRLNELKKQVATRIQKLLDDKELRQADLVERTGKPKSQISAILSQTHNLTLRTIADLETALGSKIIEIPSK
jgi:antitoxin component HigA of HigAB toxin-antitoxin module